MRIEVIKKTETVDSFRFRRFMAGETVEEIAENDGVSVETAQASIEQASRREHMIRQFQIVELKQKGQIENEKFRQRVRREHSDAAQRALAFLLKGGNTRRTDDEATGNVNFEEVVGDREVMARGLAQYRKLASLEEKPTVVPTIQIQNNAVFNTSGGYDFERTLARIRAKQKEHHPEFLIEPTAEESDDTEI